MIGMRGLLVPLAVALLGDLAVAASHSDDGPVSLRPPDPGALDQNVLILIADDVGVDRVRAYGHTNASGNPIAPSTRNIDRLARQGVLFRNAWSNPLCSPTRAAVATGRYPSKNGIGHLIGGTSTYIGLNTSTPTVADLIPARYVGAMIGKWHLAEDAPLGSANGGVDHAVRCGFDAHVGTMGNLVTGGQNYFLYDLVRSFRQNPGATTVTTVTQYATTRTTNDALAAIESMGGAPWVVWVAFHAGHAPFHVPPTNLQQSEPPNPSSRLSTGKSMIEALDSEIGRLLAEIPPKVLRRTTVIFFGDNGTNGVVVEPPFPATRAKSTIYNGGVNVPFIVRGPSVSEALRGTESDALIDVTDVLPTVLELTGAPIPAGLDGTSIVPYLTSANAPAQREWIYAEGFEPNFDPSTGATIGTVALTRHDQTARDDRYKLNRWTSDNGGVPTVVEEFYDLQADYFETTNLLDPSGAPPVALQGVYDTLAAVLDARSQ